MCTYLVAPILTYLNIKDTIMLYEFTTQSKHQRYKNDELTFRLWNIHNTIQRKQEGANKICKLFGCSNNVFGLGTVCEGHHRNKDYYGTYNPTPFKFNIHISQEAKDILSLGYSSEILDAFTKELDQFYTNPHFYSLVVLTGKKARRNTSSKEYQANYIIHNKPSNLSRTAVKLALTYLHYIHNNMDGGDELKHNLSKSLVTKSGASGLLSIRMVLGATILENFSTHLNNLAEDINNKFNLKEVIWQH